MKKTYVLICSEPRGGSHEVANWLKKHLLRSGRFATGVSATEVVGGLVSELKGEAPRDLVSLGFFDGLGGTLVSHGALRQKGFWGRLSRMEAERRLEGVKVDSAYVIISGLPYAEDLSQFPNSCKVWVYCPEEKRILMDPASIPDRHPSRFSFDLYLGDDVFDYSATLYEDTPENEAKRLQQFLLMKETPEFKVLSEEGGEECLLV